MMKTFDYLILIGRPACGKSEFIDFMKKSSVSERAERFHIGELEELDDFLWLWEKFEEDDIWEKMGKPRLYSGAREHAYIVTSDELLEFMFHKFNQKIEKDYLNNPHFYDSGTLFVEFSRGKDPDGGYTKALNLFSKEILELAAVLYIDVSYEESQRRNIQRYEEKLKHSVLAHKVPEEDMIRFSATNDWAELTDNRESGLVTLNGVDVPFMTMKNEPELSVGPEIAERYENALNQLFKLYSK